MERDTGIFFFFLAWYGWPWFVLTRLDMDSAGAWRGLKPAVHDGGKFERADGDSAVSVRQDACHWKKTRARIRIFTGQ